MERPRGARTLTHPGGGRCVQRGAEGSVAGCAQLCREAGLGAGRSGKRRPTRPQQQDARGGRPGNPGHAPARLSHPGSLSECSTTLSL